MTPAHHAIHRLARAALKSRALDFTAPPLSIGDITLLPHQRAAVAWLLPRLDHFGGALLADPPGLGKTYVALAIAHTISTRPLVIAPATLRHRWLDAARETHTQLDFISTERLSAPATPPTPHASLVIIDEAHHLRTPHTRRHDRTTAICEHARVLLLSATPIHNHTRDITHLAALFHLPLTHLSAARIRNELTLRRTLAQIHAATPDTTLSASIPLLRHRRPLRVRSAASELPARIAALPPLTSDTENAHRLLQLGLLHALRSSDAAARARIRRRIASAIAVEHAALTCITPDRALRRAFASHDGDVQLAIPQLLGTPTETADPRLATVAARQRHALEAMLPLLTGTGDRERSHALQRLARWSTRPVVAFTQFSETASALYQHLRLRPGIALLSGSTARIASGVISRQELLDRLLRHSYHAPHQSIRLLIATDVLSEGLSLPGVATIVHLDLPWTAARLDQRCGRAARIGAPVPTVDVVQLPAPIRDDLRVRLHVLLAGKRRAMAVLDGEHPTDTELVTLLRTLTDTHAAAETRTRWLTLSSPRVSHVTTLAIVALNHRRFLVAHDLAGLRRPSLTDWRALTALSAAAPQHQAITALRHALRAWQVDREMSGMVSDPHDIRLTRRREADALLYRSAHVTRALHAAAVTRTRLAPRDAARRGAERSGAEDNGDSATAALEQNSRARRRKTEREVYVAVTLVPTVS